MVRPIAILCAFLLMLMSGALAFAQDQVTGVTGSATLNVRQLPARNATRIAQLPPNTAVVVEARSEAGDWVLITAPSVGTRGWVALGYVTFDRPVRVMEELPVSSESVSDPNVGGTTGSTGDTTAIAVIIEDPDDNPPVLLDSNIWRRVRQIWARGRQLGNDPWVLMKVGESNTAGTVYLCNFEWRAYSLGGYTHLQGVVDEFSRTGSFCRPNVSAQNGFATINVLDPQFAPSDLCQPNENALDCEVRRSRPSFALIYIGLADTGILTADEFNDNLTAIVNDLAAQGVIPILQTWATADVFNGNNRPQLFNEEIRNVARTQRVPLLDIRSALLTFSNKGTGPDGYHLSVRDTTRSEFGGDELVYGRTYREYQTLQLLYDLITGLNS